MPGEYHCERCDFEGPAAKEYPAQGLAKCGGCGRLFQPKPRPAPGGREAEAEPEPPPPVAPRSPRPIPAAAVLHLIFGGPQALALWGLLALCAWFSAAFPGFEIPEGAPTFVRDFAELAHLAPWFLLLAVAWTALSGLALVPALRRYIVFPGTSLRAGDSGLRTGRGGATTGAGRKTYLVRATYLDEEGTEREASALSYDLIRFRPTGFDVQILRHPEDRSSAYILNVYPGKIRIDEEGRVVARASLAWVLVLPVLALLGGLAYLARAPLAP